MIPTTVTIGQRLRIDGMKARAIRATLESHRGDVRATLARVSDIIGGFGVETLPNDDDAKRVPYVNMGDPYTSTVLFRGGSFRVECWGDVVVRDPSYA